MSFLIPITMVLIGLIWRKNPPRYINSLHGYRTSLSMKDQDSWDFAHKYISKIWLKFGILMLAITGLFNIFFYKQSNFEGKILILVFLQIVVMVLTIPPTERALKRRNK